MFGALRSPPSLLIFTFLLVTAAFVGGVVVGSGRTGRVLLHIGRMKLTDQRCISAHRFGLGGAKNHRLTWFN